MEKINLGYINHPFCYSFVLANQGMYSYIYIYVILRGSRLMARGDTTQVMGILIPVQRKGQVGWVLWLEG